LSNRTKIGSLFVISLIKHYLAHVLEHQHYSVQIINQMNPLELHLVPAPLAPEVSCKNCKKKCCKKYKKGKKQCKRCPKEPQL
jgi:hypothetical protein